MINKNFEVCKDCEYFYQHYGLSNKSFNIHTLDCGHCLEKYEKLITKEKTCPRFKQKVSQKDKRINALNVLRGIEKICKELVGVFKTKK